MQLVLIITPGEAQKPIIKHKNKDHANRHSAMRLATRTLINNESSAIILEKSDKKMTRYSLIQPQLVECQMRVINCPQSQHEWSLADVEIAVVRIRARVIGAQLAIDH